MIEGAAAASVGGGQAGVSGDHRTSKWEAVDADMRRIFAPGTRAPHRPRQPAASDIQPDTRSPRVRRLILPLALLTCAAGAAAGLIVVKPLRDATAVKPATSLVRAAPSANTAPRAMTVTAPIAFAAPSNDPVRHGKAVPAPPAREDAETVTADEVAPMPARFRSQDARIACDDEDAAPSAACSRSDVLAADRDLRLAYVRAVDAGVDRDRLVSIRNRWARLRATDYDRPGDLMAGYAELADRLDRAADDQGEMLR